MTSNDNERDKRIRDYHAGVDRRERAANNERRRAEASAALVEQLDPNQLGDSFIAANLDTLFSNCTSCKAGFRHAMNRWNIDEEPDALIVKIDRVAMGVYWKQGRERQPHITVKSIAVMIVEHIEATRAKRQQQPTTLDALTYQITTT